MKLFVKSILMILSLFLLFAIIIVNDQTRIKFYLPENFLEYFFLITLLFVIIFIGAVFFELSGRIYSALISLPSLLSSRATIKSAPGNRLTRLIELLPEKQRKIFQQEISDMRLEYYEALNEKKVLLARIIVGRYYIGLGWSVFMWVADRVKEVAKLVPPKD